MNFKASKSNELLVLDDFANSRRDSQSLFLFNFDVHHFETNVVFRHTLRGVFGIFLAIKFFFS